MRPLRLASYNVEWFTQLFGNDNRLLTDREWSARYNVTRGDQADSLGIVFTAMDADGVMIIEGPNQGHRRDTVLALENFARFYQLRTSRAVMGFANDSHQEIAFLYDPNRIQARHDPRGGGDRDALGARARAPRFDTSFYFDIDVDAVPELIRFSKPPLELAVEADGQALRLIGVHAKSKAPHGANSPEEEMRIAIDNRRKQLAECVWLRRRVDEHLTAGDSVMVMGDFNDGPGLDEYEALFGHSGIEIVLGQNCAPEMKLHDPNAVLALVRKPAITPTSARFWLDDQKRYFEAMLDYIMISPDLAARKPTWRIWHPLNDPGCLKVPELREALLTASDHFPVSIDIDLARPAPPVPGPAASL